MRAAPMIATVTLFWASAAMAGQTWDDNWKSCDSNDPATRITGCSALIQLNKEAPGGLAMAYMNRGTAYTVNGDYDRAIADLDQAIRLNGKDANAFYNRGYAYTRKNDLDRAIQDFDQALNLNPNFAIAFEFRGDAYDEKGDPVRAIQDFDQAVRLEPKDAGHFFSRGLAYGHKGDNDRAIQDFDQAIKLEPSYEPAFESRGFAYYRKKAYDQAIKDLSEAIRMNPKDADAFDGRGNTYDDKGDPARAIQDYDQAIQLNPSAWTFLIDRGLAHGHMGDDDRAIGDFDQALQLHPNDATTLVSRGNAYMQKEDYDKAIQNFDQALQLNPNYADAFIFRGGARSDKGDYDHAIEDFNDGLRLNPKSSDALLGRGDAYLGKKQDDRAIEDYNQALFLNPQNSGVLSSRSHAYMDLGKFAAAEADLTAVLKLDPSYPYYALWLYQARFKAGQDGRSELEKYAKQMKLAEWPGQVINLYLGKTTPEAILTAAANPDAHKDREQHCEAYFYLGEYALMKGQTTEARRFFQQSVDTGVLSFVEYAYAQTELNRLPGGGPVPGPEVAEVKRGLVSEPVAPVAPVVNGRYYALVIGIDQYPAPMHSLATAVNDAQAIAKDLKELYGFEVKLLLDGDATRDRILDAIEQYQQTLNENDSLLIYYAGHGYAIHNPDNSYDKAYWLPADANSNASSHKIISDDLTTDIRELPARHVLIISDSCYAGGLLRDGTSLVPDSSQTYLSKMMRDRSRTLMASGGDEPVSDSGSGGHSVFAAVVLKALEGFGRDVFTANQLFVDEVQPRVAGHADQTPQYGLIRNSSHDNGDFVFVRQGTAGHAP